MKSRWRRVLRGIGIGLAGVVAVLLALVLIGLAVISTPAADKPLTRLAIKEANKAFQGNLSIELVRLRGNHLIVRGVVLKDPDGEVVAQIAEIDLRLALSRLVSKTLEITELTIREPHLDVRQGPKGSNLSRALAARTLQAPSPSPSSPSRLVVQLDHLLLTGGAASWVPVGVEPHASVTGLNLEGHVRLVGAAIDGQIHADLSVEAPLRTPMKLDLGASTSGASQLATLSMKAGDSALDVEVAEKDPQNIQVDLKQLLVSPDLVRALQPDSRMLIAARIAGRASLIGTSASGEFRIDSGAAQAHVKGQVDVKSFRSEGVSLEVGHVNLEELLANGPPSNLNLLATASGGGRDLDSLEGAAELNVPNSSLMGEPLGPFHVKAAANGGRYELIDLVAALPGLSVKARGTADSKTVDLRGSADVADLHLMGVAVRRILGTSDFGVAGNGHLGFSLSGDRKNPSAAVSGEFPRLRYQDNRVEGLVLEAHVPVLPHPEGARLQLTATRLTAAGRTLQRVAVSLGSKGPQLALEATVQGRFPTSLGLVVELRHWILAGTLKHLELRYPNADWKLSHPTEFSFQGGAISIDALEVTSGQQSIALQGHLENDSVKAAVALSRVDLANLPTTLLSPNLKFGGLLTTSVTAAGKLAHPIIQAKLDLKKGSWNHYSNVSATLEAQFARDVALGKMSVQGAGVELQSQFELPVRELVAGGDQPIKLLVRIPELQLAPVMKELGARSVGSGLFSADVSLTGTSSQPSLRLEVMGRQLRLQRLPEANARVLITGTPKDPLEARVEMEIRNQKSFVELETPYSLRDLIRHTPTQSELLRSPLAVRAEIREFPLPWLYTSGLIDRQLLGVLEAHADIKGPLVAPHGQLEIQGKGISTPGLGITDVDLVASTHNDRMRAHVEMRQNARAIIQLTAAIQAPPSEFVNLEKLKSATLSLDGQIGPVDIGQLQAMLADPNANPIDAAPSMTGSMMATITARGSLMAPALDAEFDVRGLGSKGFATGDVHATYRYQAAQHVLQALAKSGAGGTLDLSANTQLDISYPAVKQARFSGLPLTAEVKANDLNLSFLSGLGGFTVQVGGLLRGTATLEGTLPTPKLRGDLDWRQGILVTHGNGEFRNIHLAVSGDQQHLKVSELSAESGRGKAVVSANAAESGQRWTVDAKISLKRFPLVSEGQLLATAWLDANGNGEFQSSRLSLNPLHISDARVELPDVARKDLQQLSTPTDVVLVRHGKPIGTQTPSKPSGSGVGGAGPSPSPLQLTAVLEAPRNLWVEAGDVNIEMGLSEGFRVDYADSVGVFGDVQLMRGRVAVFGRNFDVDRDSKAHFSGVPTEPDLNVGATYTNETEQVKVHLTLSGSPENASVNVSSNPPLSETEIYTLIATGRLSLHSGTGTTSPQGQAASILGSVAASQLKKTIAAHLPLDVLSIEAGDNGLTGSKLRAGTYVNDRLYLGFTGRIGADPLKGENSNQVDVEYQLSKHWSLQGDFGDAKAGGASVIWSKEY